jgi:elongation factor 1-gamma
MIFYPQKLYGDNQSPSVIELMHLINLTNAKIEVENITSEDTEKKSSLVQKTPTLTLPLLETKDGNISETNAIKYYICQKYKPEMLGNSIIERGKVNQWVEFACNELNRCRQNIINNMYDSNNSCKEQSGKDEAKLKEYVKLLDKELEKNEFIVSDKITLADITLFKYLLFLMCKHYPEKMRNAAFPHVSKWFEKIMTLPETIKAYGKIELCKNKGKSNKGNAQKGKEENTKNGKKDKKNEKKEQKNEKKDKKKDEKDSKKEESKTEISEKKEEEYVPGLLETKRFDIKEKENNPLDSLPPTKFDLEKFKTEFIKNSNKKSAMKNFWKNYDPEGYSLWYIEYNNEPNEFITLFHTVIVKGDILQQLEYFKKYCFGVLGVYGADGDYKIRGCLMWRGNEIPDEIKEINCYDKLSIRKLDYNQKKDQQLVHDYWTKINEQDKVFKKPAIDTRYFY